MLKKNNNTQIAYEFFYYFYYLNNIFFYFLFFKNSEILNKFFKINKLINKFLQIFLINHNKFFLTNKNIIKFNNFSIKSKFEVIDNPLIETDIFFINKRICDKNFYRHKFKLLNIFFLFNYSVFNSHFKNHHNFKFFYVSGTSHNRLIIISLSKLFNRWRDAYDLLFNIFYYNFNPLIFGSFLFKNEVLALN